MLCLLTSNGVSAEAGSEPVSSPEDASGKPSQDLLYNLDTAGRKVVRKADIPTNMKLLCRGGYGAVFRARLDGKCIAVKFALSVRHCLIAFHPVCRGAPGCMDQGFAAICCVHCPLTPCVALCCHPLVACPPLEGRRFFLLLAPSSCMFPSILEPHQVSSLSTCHRRDSLATPATPTRIALCGMRWTSCRVFTIPTS
jgi:hypothetical protein